MSDSNGTENQTESAADVSGFGGLPLRPVTVAAVAAGDSDSVTDALAEMGLEDCEQLVAATAVPGISEMLRDSLGLNKQSFKSLLDNARSGLSEERAALVSRPAPKDLGLGVRPPPADIIAAAEASAVDAERQGLAPEAVALAQSINLIPFMPPVRNQGSRGTCVAFALTALNEYVLRRRGLGRNLSEQHLYYEVKLIDGAPNGCGTWQAKAVTALRDRGECREYIWPYDPNPPCNNHGTRPSTARSNGWNYRLNTFAVAARNVAAYKTQLAAQRPVTLSIPVYDSWYQSNEVRRSGRITMRVGNEASSGGHAVIAVGYQDSQSSPGGGYFIVRNSWSTSWAYESPYGGGYGTIPYQYITNDAWEAYSAVVPGVGDEDEPVDDEAPADASMTKTLVRIKVGSNVEITIEDGGSDTAPGRVAGAGGRSGRKPGRVAGGGGRSGRKPGRVAGAAGQPPDDDDDTEE
jgi:C1A family cysteine protease